MAERGGRYYAVRTEPQAYSTQTIQEIKIQQLEQEIAVLKQRNSELPFLLAPHQRYSSWSEQK
jgi:hypothetical protein